MKGIYTIAIIILFLAMVLLPLISMKQTVLPTLPPTESNSGSQSSEKLRVLDVKTDKISEMPIRDYVIGVVSAEMAAEYEIEALKAQAVVAYTYAMYKKEHRKGEEYDVTDTSAKDQAFLSVEEAKERFGENYQKYNDKISTAVDSVTGKKITYQGKVILACCHSISGGKTESAELLWGGSYPYLQPVESAGDLLNPKYLSEVTITKEDFKSAFKEQKIEFTDDTDEWITDINRSSSGYVLSLKLCGTELKGSSFRSALKLRSSNFDVEVTKDSFKFSVRGYGHGAGMSQYGAQYMAQQGSTYEEILKWYYTGCVVE